MITVNMKHERVKLALENATLAFWKAIKLAFPEAKHSDAPKGLPSEMTDNFDTHAAEALEVWIFRNVPVGSGVFERERELEANFSMVAYALQARGYDASVFASGGNIDTIRVHRGNRVFYFGTAAETWGADVWEADGEGNEQHLDEAIWTKVPCTETDIAYVAGAIATAVDIGKGEKTC